MTDETCRVASPLTAGLSPVGWRFVPSEKWGEQLLTQDPKTVQLARDTGRDVEPLYAESQMLARVAAERERCARIVETQDTNGDSVGCWFELLAAKIRA
jgi:hypothetical protein